jgi:hypothetical protein
MQKKPLKQCGPLFITICLEITVWERGRTWGGRPGMVLISIMNESLAKAGRGWQLPQQSGGGGGGGGGDALHSEMSEI